MSLDINPITSKTTNKTDSELIDLYKSGTLEAFKELVERYTPIIYNFTARIADKNDASDIVQEIFIKVWKNIEKYDTEKASFKTWIFTIARNTATDFLRKKKPVLFSDLEKYNEEDSLAENIRDETILPDQAFAKLEDIENLNNVLEKLRADYREVLVLHYQENMTFDEIGKILDKPLNTVKSKHRRAIIELRSYL